MAPGVHRHGTTATATWQSVKADIWSAGMCFFFVPFGRYTDARQLSDDSRDDGRLQVLREKAAAEEKAVGARAAGEGGGQGGERHSPNPLGIRGA